MLRISFANDSDQRLVETLRSKGPRIVAVLMTKLNALMIQLASYIVGQKLSGQVLARRTGILAGSIRAIPATTEGTRIVAAVEGGGGPAFYGRIHEEGPEQGAYPIVAVRARCLAFMMDGRKILVKSVMHPAVKLRPFMSPSLDENAAMIETELRAAVDREVNLP